MKPKYITPRLAIIEATPQTQIDPVIQILKDRHSKYFYIFNLSQYKLPLENQTDCKWRGIPFSITEMIKILTQIDIYLRINVANTAIICVSSKQMNEFATLMIKNYILALSISVRIPCDRFKLKQIKDFAKSSISNYSYLTSEFLSIYQETKIKNPPIKIIESIQLEPNNSFIPIFQIYTQSRYNEFELVYTHKVQDQLINYYLQLNKPLQTSIGKRFYDEKPQTNFLSSPTIVYGDVKITIYSYKTLKRIKQFSIGFNTVSLSKLNKNKTLSLDFSNFYQINEGLNQQIKIHIKFDEYCENQSCHKYSNCQDCKEISKRLGNRYPESQIDLQKLYKLRTVQEISQSISL